ncbi:MAG: nucleotide exchange factor GrpE [Nitrospirota bacterium]|nr:MAG: nucleotide exchange factor GrpE [Nitrospirota bacterium]
MSEENKDEMRIEIDSESDVEALQELADEIEIEEEEVNEGSKKLKAELAELNDKYMRLYAEFENYRKRVVKEKEDIQKFGTEAMLQELLTVIDTLEMALGHAEDETSPESLKEGIEMTLREFRKVLNRNGLELIEAIGKPFDPAFHEAMNQVERDDVEEGIVVEEYRKGYSFEDKLLRPSLVAVSKAASKGTEEKDQNNNQEIKEEEENG